MNEELSGHGGGSDHGFGADYPIPQKFAESGEGHIFKWPFVYKLSLSTEEHTLDRDGITLYLASIALTVRAQRRMNIMFPGVS